MAEADRGTDDRDVAVELGGLEEGAVELELVDLEAAEIAERRIAGAEIVEGDAESRCRGARR